MTAESGQSIYSIVPIAHHRHQVLAKFRSHGAPQNAKILVLDTTAASGRPKSAIHVYQLCKYGSYEPSGTPREVHASSHNLISTSCYIHRGIAQPERRPRSPLQKVFFPIDYRCCRSTRDSHMRALSSNPIVQHSPTIPKLYLQEDSAARCHCMMPRSQSMHVLPSGSIR